MPNSEKVGLQLIFIFSTIIYPAVAGLKLIVWSVVGLDWPYPRPFTLFQLFGFKLVVFQLG